MIDFILSKLGILIFAVSVAGILLYFSGSIKDVFLADETVQISNIVAKQIKYMAESDNLCVSTKVILPRNIDIFGISNPGFSSIYYLLDISKVTNNGNTFVVFTIYNKQTKKQIALESFLTSSDVVFYDFLDKKNVDKITIDPTAKEVVYMVKSKSFEEGQEKTNLYFINCDYDTSLLSVQNNDPFRDCYSKLNELSNKETEYPFYCVPKGESQ